MGNDMNGFTSTGDRGYRQDEKG